MIEAKIDGRRVLCGRPGCGALLGHLDNGRVGLSLRWYWEAPRWRLGRHERTFTPIASVGKLHGSPGAEVVRWPEGNTWVIPPLTAIECHRCRAVQNVATVPG